MSVTDAVKSELAAMPVELQTGHLAESALKLALLVDNSFVTTTSSLVKELRACMTELNEQAFGRKENVPAPGSPDDLARQRAERQRRSS